MSITQNIGLSVMITWLAAAVLTYADSQHIKHILLDIFLILVVVSGWSSVSWDLDIRSHHYG
ncbi:hypothetical protein EDC96DRAFT_527612 [Choanephora cucurbitarum]|nr:hypothetical protein EDC96DRAFT_527612 [Choanephora cucurbitarum]